MSPAKKREIRIRMAAEILSRLSLVGLDTLMQTSAREIDIAVIRAWGNKRKKGGGK